MDNTCWVTIIEAVSFLVTVSFLAQAGGSVDESIKPDRKLLNSTLDVSCLSPILRTVITHA